MATPPVLYQNGDHASRPAADSGCVLYTCETHGLIYRSDGATWSTWLTLPSAGASAAADVTIADAGGYFTGTDVETALQELGAAGGAGGSPWELVVDQDGSDFSGWTGGSGTWASAGGIIQQTATSGERYARYNTKLSHAALLMEAEMRFPTTTGMAGIVVSQISGTTPNVVVRMQQGSTNVEITHYGVAVRRTMTGPSSKATATWYKLRALVIGTNITVWEDATRLGTTWDVTGITNGAGDLVGLWTDGDADFRNIKAWTLALPA